MLNFKDVIDHIRAIAPRISTEPLAAARHVPDASSVPTQCFSNAERKAQQAGGGVLHGWMFHAREPAALPGRGYVLAVNHAVWHTSDKSLIDVTPFHADPAYHPIVVNGDAVLFLIDSAATPIQNEHAGLALPSWFFPLTDDEALAAHVATLTSEELAKWEEQLAETEGLKGTRQAADVLRSRRKVR